MVEMALRGEVLGRAAGEVVHDAKNPLHALSIHLGILAEKLSAGHDLATGAEKNLAAMRDQVLKVDAHLKKLVRLSALAPEQTAVVPLAVREALQFLSHQARRRGVELVFEGNEGIRAAAPQTVVQDLVCLLALSAMETGEGPVLRVGLAQEGGAVRLRAERTQPVDAADPAGLRARALSLCQRASELHQGKVEWSLGSAVLRLPGAEDER